MNRELRRPPARYDEDFHRWSHEQAQLLREGRFDALDRINIVEELETLGRSEAAALRSSLRLIILHLLKLTHQPERASRSWRSSTTRTPRPPSPRCWPRSVGWSPGGSSWCSAAAVIGTAASGP